MVPDRTFLSLPDQNIFISVQEVVSGEGFSGGNTAASVTFTVLYFHVIAAPRPSGRPDLDSIRARTTEGRFFL